ncbi:MAG: hypothetical protein NTV61_11345 [Candidatus Bathyarchaeota archaeon]|nr:hypothetical protein [Candidatus Bathyarchaeota archaeon]
MGEQGDPLRLIENLARFTVKAKEEWRGFQRLSGFETLLKMKGGESTDIQKGLTTFNTLLVEGDNPGRVFLGLEEQNREEGDPVLGAVFMGLRSPGAQAGYLTPLVVFTDAYDWGTANDLPLYDEGNSLCSPIFMHRKVATNRKAVDPWLDGASPSVNTGVLGAVTLNLPRAAFTSGDEGEFFDRVWDLTGLAVEGLEAKRSHFEGELKAGRMPATGSIVASFDDFFGAVGVVGLNEALLNIVERGIGSMQGKVVAYKILEAIHDRLEEKDKETGHRFCLTAEPSDGAAYRLAELDRLKYPEIKTSGVEAPYYTGSTCLPGDYTEDLWDALEHQKRLQTLYGGGTIFNICLEKGISDGGSCKTLVKKLVEKTPLPCFAFSPTVNVSPSRGEAKRYERMGYWYKPVSDMVAGEIEEVRLRRPFAVLSGW